MAKRKFESVPNLHLFVIFKRQDKKLYFFEKKKYIWHQQKPQVINSSSSPPALEIQVFLAASYLEFIHSLCLRFQICSN